MRTVSSMLILLFALFFNSCAEAQEENGSNATGKDRVFEKIEVSELDRLLANDEIQIIDVRTENEISQGMIPGARNIDVMQWDNFVSEVEQLDRENPVLVYCKVGGRSAKAFAYLKENGFSKVYDLKGGFDSWKRDQQN